MLHIKNVIKFTITFFMCNIIHTKCYCKFNKYYFETINKTDYFYDGGYG